MPKVRNRPKGDKRELTIEIDGLEYATFIATVTVAQKFFCDTFGVDFNSLDIRVLFEWKRTPDPFIWFSQICDPPHAEFEMHPEDPGLYRLHLTRTGYEYIADHARTVQEKIDARKIRIKLQDPDWPQRDFEPYEFPRLDPDAPIPPLKSFYT